MKNNLLFIISTLLMAACGQSDSNTAISVSQEMIVDPNAGSVPYLTKDNKSNTVLTWAKSINDSISIFCYAISKDGNSFGKPISIPGSENMHPHAENLPKIIFKPSGEIIALWGAANPNPKNKYSGLVYYAQSFDEGVSWSAVKKLVADTAGFDQRYYDVALLKNGEAAIVWLDNRKTNGKDGSALYFASTNGKDGFKNEKLISQSCCQCCRTNLFVDSKNNIHVLYRGIVQDSIRDMVHIVSNDNGNSFSQAKRISEDNWVINGCPHTGPAMTENNKGLQFAWFTGGKNKGCYYTQSSDNGESFTAKDSVSFLGSHPQINKLSNDAIVIAWDEAIKTDDGYQKRLGIQLRDSNGSPTKKTFIEDENTAMTYPVLSTLGSSKMLLAYSIQKDNKSYVGYRLLQF